MTRPLIALLMFCVLFVTACDDEDRAPMGDDAPDTTVQSSAVDTPGRTVTFTWNGSDDGEVVAFEWRLSANGADGIVDVADTTMLPWNETEAIERTFSLDADLPGPPPGSDEDLFFQTYTFFVRAIDDQGQRDPTPAHASVTATTVAPTVRIREQIARTTCGETSTGYGFSWEVDDPDADPGDELEVRWLLIPLGGPQDPCLTDLQYEELDPRPITADDPRWSDWVTYVEPGGEGGRHGESDLPQAIGSNYLFAVQARDAAGAVTPMFEWGRNVTHFRTASDRFPLLVVQGPEISWVADVAMGPVRWRRAVPEGFRLDFHAQASVPTEVDAPFEYRWGVNVADPMREDDPGWRTEWTSEPPVVEDLVLEAGPHTILVMTRDRYGAVTSTQFALDVLEVPDRSTQRPLLVVDATDEADLPNLDATHDALVESWLVAIPGFSRSRDVIDLASDGDQLTMAKMLEYRGVLWLSDAMPPRDISISGPGQGPAARWLGAGWLPMLELYQRHVGNVLVMGPGVMARALGPQLTDVLLPIDITDPPFSVYGVALAQPELRAQVGQSTYPRQAFGMQIVDRVAPVVLGGVGERPPATEPCDLLATVRVAPEAVSTFGIDGAPYDAWEPVAERLTAFEPGVPASALAASLLREEIYDRPFDGHALEEQTGVIPLMRGVARADFAGDTECASGDETSANTGWPVALASRRFVKDRAPGPDVVVGLDPFGFEAADVRAFVEAVVFDLWGAADR